jgi:hypothetical protein
MNKASPQNMRGLNSKTLATMDNYAIGTDERSPGAGMINPRDASGSATQTYDGIERTSSAGAEVARGARRSSTADMYRKRYTLLGT